MVLRLALGIPAAVIGLSSALTLAQDQSAPNASPAPGRDGGSSTCMAQGSQYQLGEEACIPACHGRRRLARCDMTGTQASWTYVSQDCPSAMINAPWPSDWSEVPVVADMTPVPLVVDKSAPVPAAKTITFATFSG